MDDFNADNAKIDTALAEKMGGAEEILAYEYTGNGDTIVDVALPEDMDWSKYNIVWMEVSLVKSGSGACGVHFFQPVGPAPLRVSFEQSNDQNCQALLLWFPGRKNDGNTFGVIFPGGDTSRMGGPLGPGDLVRLVGDQNAHCNISKGTTVRLWGI